MTAIAGKLGVSFGTLNTWLSAEPERCARAREARIETARLWDEKAEAGIAQAVDAFQLSRAKELAHHYRWRAKAISPRDYGDKQLHTGADGESPVGFVLYGERESADGDTWQAQHSPK